VGRLRASDGIFIVADRPDRDRARLAAAQATRRYQTLRAALRAVIVQIAVIVVPIFEQGLRQLGQIEVDRPILESINTF
jgi:hypothetical protein